MINNRQAGRRRGRGGGNNNGNGAPRQGGNPGRPDNGNRIDNRARGNASQLHEKYKNLAADSQRQGDRVNTEYYLQFADHYFRVLSETRSRFEEQNQRRPRDDSFDEFDGNDSDDYADEGEPIRAGEQSMAADGGQDGRRESRNRNERRDNGRENGPREGQRDAQRDGGQRETTARDGNVREEGREDVREDGRRDEGRREEGRRERAPRATRPDTDEQRFEREPARPPAVDVANDAAPVAEAASEAEPRRRTRTRRERPVEAAEPAVGFDADRLPPSLGLAAGGDPAPEADEKPRRRRTRAPSAEATQAS